MELHRVRFFSYVPTAVNALVFSPTGQQVAVARANSDIELWHVGHDWVLEKVPLFGAGGRPLAGSNTHTTT